MNTSYFFFKLFKFFKDENVKWTKKALFIVPFIYFVSPITLIPYYFFALAGLLDNIFVLLIGLYYIKKTIDEYDPYDSKKEGEDKHKDNVIDMKKNDYDLDD